MAKNSFNNLNVPHYAPKDTPSIDLSPNSDWRDHQDLKPVEKDRKAETAKKMNDRRRFVKETFLDTGTKFTITVEENTRPPVKYPKWKDGDSRPEGYVEALAAARLEAAKIVEEELKCATEGTKNPWLKPVTYTGRVKRMSRPTWDGCMVMVEFDQPVPFKRRAVFGLATFADNAKPIKEKTDIDFEGSHPDTRTEEEVKAYREAIDYEWHPPTCECPRCERERENYD